MQACRRLADGDSQCPTVVGVMDMVRQRRDSRRRRELLLYVCRRWTMEDVWRGRG